MHDQGSGDQAQQEALRTAMKRLSALGYPVIPCNGKRPLILKWTDIVAASNRQIDEWFQRFGSLTTYGVPMGNASGLVGIDEDGPLAATKLQEISGGELADTWAYSTPSGGIHRVYALPTTGECRPIKWKLDGEHSELALMGAGQMMIFPPGATDVGAYRWDDRFNPDTMPRPAMASHWLLNLVGEKSSESRARTTAQPADQRKAPDPDALAEQVLRRLASRCDKFRRALEVQRFSGLPEEDWHLHVTNLSRAGHPEAATLFSTLSAKHGPRSEERVQLLSEEGRGPMVRCTTFGCDKEQISHCFGGQLRIRDGEITNSPGKFVVNMEAALPPSGTAYAPYLEQLKECGEYVIDQDGNLCGVDRQGNEFQICNFVARPLEERVLDDGVQQTRAFRIEGVLGGQVLPEAEVSAPDFARMDWVMDRWGLQAVIRPGVNRKDLLRDFIQRMSPLASRRTVFTHLGWRKLDDKGWVYLHAGGAIGAAGVSVELGPQLARYTLPAVPADPADAALTSLVLLDLAPRRVTYPLLAMVYLAPLLEPLRIAGIEPTFVLWLAGTTGTRKTSIGKVFLSHFGPFGTGGPPASFADTGNSVEKKAFVTKDAVLLVDDFISNGSHSQAERTAQQLLRGYGDRIARGRLTSSTEFRVAYQPRGVAVITGEDWPSGHSSNARLFGVEVRPGDVDLDALTEAQDRSDRLAEAMSGYIDFLRGRLNDLPAELRGRFVELRARFQRGSVHGRLSESAAWLTLAVEKMLDYMIECAAIDHVGREELSQEAVQTMDEIIETHGRTLQQEVPAIRFVRTLTALLQSKKACVYPIRGQVPSFPVGEHLGWEDENCWYLHPAATYNSVANFLARRGESIGAGERALWRELDEAALLHVESGNDGRVQRLPKKSVPGQRDRPRLLHLRKAAVQAMTDRFD